VVQWLENDSSSLLYLHVTYDAEASNQLPETTPAPKYGSFHIGPDGRVSHYEILHNPRDLALEPIKVQVPVLLVRFSQDRDGMPFPRECGADNEQYCQQASTARPARGRRFRRHSRPGRRRGQGTGPGAKARARRAEESRRRKRLYLET
jgi:hypothetical protein